MSDEEKKEAVNDAIELFIHSEKRIDEIRNDVTELIKADLGLGQKMDKLSAKQDQMYERFNEGTSKTLHKTYEKVTEIATSLMDVQHHNEKQDMNIEHQDSKIESNSKLMSRILTGVLGMFAVMLAFMFYIVQAMLK